MVIVCIVLTMVQLEDIVNEFVQFQAFNYVQFYGKLIVSKFNNTYSMLKQ